MYFKFVYSNGYCGCDEEEYAELNSEKEAEEYFEDGFQGYSFFDPDNRFVDEDDYETEEEYFEAIDNYQEGVYDYSTFEEISKEEYEENI